MMKTKLWCLPKIIKVFRPTMRNKPTKVRGFSFLKVHLMARNQKTCTCPKMWVHATKIFWLITAFIWGSEGRSSRKNKTKKKNCKKCQEGVMPHRTKNTCAASATTSVAIGIWWCKWTTTSTTTLSNCEKRRMISSTTCLNAFTVEWPASVPTLESLITFKT